MFSTQHRRMASTLLPLVSLACYAASPTLASAIPRAHATADTVAQDLQTVTQRRYDTIVGATTGATSISTW